MGNISMGLAAACMLVVAAATDECPLPTAALQHTRCCCCCWWWCCCWRCSLLLLLCCCWMLLLRILQGFCMGATWDDLHAASSLTEDRMAPATARSWHCVVSLEPRETGLQLLSVVVNQFKTPWTWPRAGNRGEGWNEVAGHLLLLLLEQTCCCADHM